MRYEEKVRMCRSAQSSTQAQRILRDCLQALEHFSIRDPQRNRPLPQRMIAKDERGHRFDHRHCSGNHARMGAIILDDVEIGARSIIGANALVTIRTKIPPGSLVLGSPAKIRRQLTLDEQKDIAR